MKTAIALVLALTIAAMAKKDLQPVNVNSSPADSLSAHLPGVGPAIAERIVQGRPYQSCKDLDAVKGLGASKLAKICPLARF